MKTSDEITFIAIFNNPPPTSDSAWKERIADENRATTAKYRTLPRELQNTSV